MKTGLLCEGGGQLGMFGVGVLQAFYDHGIRFDVNVGVSAGAANLASHLAGHRNRTVRFYNEYCRHFRYMGVGALLHAGSMVDLEYVYGELTNVIDPINYDKLLALKEELYFTATDALTGEPVYFDARDCLRNRSCEALMASSCLPVYCRPVFIDGRAYFDGGVSDSLPVRFLTEKQSCGFVAAILNRPKGYRKEPQHGQALYTKLLRRYPQTAAALARRHENYNASLSILEHLEAEGKAFLIRPQEALPITTFTRKPPERLETVRALGYEAGEAFCRQYKTADASS
ncbi:MAG: patatin family protein [Oscillospiraceae bacterium]|jgi:predicted patatin/cPLA2 family phospholipase|nr:patatin family protein [Oscillospiraceae bacterium]